MSAAEAEGARGHGSGLLERSIAFASGVLEPVTIETLGLPTPCRGWDLGMLLAHTAESLAALLEAVDARSVRVGRVLEPLPAAVDDPAAALVASLRLGAARLLQAWTAADEDDRPVTVGGRPMGASLVAGTGAIEIAVHGWDIAWATGRPRPIPPVLAGDLLGLALTLVTGGTRPGLFAPPVPVPQTAGAHDRLLAHLGRDPYAQPG